jgi:hypothetical protein
MRIDHVALAVPDLDAAARALLEAHGLASTPTSPQPDWGTAHRLVPLGGGFLELVSVAHPEIAEKSPVGRRVARCASTRSLAFWAVRPEALGPVAARLGLTVGEGERHRGDGTAYSWQVAGVDVAVEYGLPFFIHWLASGSLPHRLPVQHEARPEGFAWIEVGGDLARLADWLGPADLPLRKAHDERPLVRCALRTDRGEIVLGG